jgi:hypothetical protein
MPTAATDLAIGLAIALVFIAPALAWPTLGRALLGVFFIGGATFTLLYTLPNLPPRSRRSSPPAPSRCIETSWSLVLRGALTRF